MVGFDCQLYNTHDTYHLTVKQQCNHSVLAKSQPDDGTVYCQAKWDGIGCWNYTEANTTATIPCPTFVHGVEHTAFAEHLCTSDGEWWLPDGYNSSGANYTKCIPDAQWEHLIVNIFITGYSVSVISLILALCTFQYFRQLSCVRISIHKHLFVSYIINGLMWILYYILVAKNTTVLTSNPIWCQVLHVLCQHFVCCNFLWMFSEGLYLHTLVVVVFISEEKLLLAAKFIGWGVPVCISLIYGLVRGLALQETDLCWIYDSCSQWIIFGPIILTLLVSVVFLIDIVRVLIVRFWGVHTHNDTQNQKATRAAIILVPLLGIQFFLFPVEPEGATARNVFQFFSAVVISFQGFAVGLIYCFCNSEVLSLLRLHCRRCQKYLPVGQYSMTSRGRRSHGSGQATAQTDSLYGRQSIEQTNPV